MTIAMTKRQLIHQLLVAKSQAYDAESYLLLKQMPYEANVVKNHGKELSRRVDSLIAEIMSDWIENSDRIIIHVYSINKELERCITDIEYDVNVAENIVKLVGFIDEIVKIINMIT